MNFGTVHLSLGRIPVLSTGKRSIN